jgi:hypothetical protein
MKNNESPTRKTHDTQDMLFMLAGAAMMAGLVARNKYFGLGGLFLLACTAAPDAVRYVKISRM